MSRQRNILFVRRIWEVYYAGLAFNQWVNNYYYTDSLCSGGLSWKEDNKEKGKLRVRTLLRLL